jgi:hypothetical protein
VRATLIRHSQVYQGVEKDSEVQIININIAATIIPGYLLYLLYIQQNKIPNLFNFIIEGDKKKKAIPGNV